ncbi:MAG: Ribosome biogenesis protein erb1 [Bathelium mastoideum]|nr:MAG: Ribosome biogenesis protein erb1 [Bathelium mastoideum]
MANAVAGRKRKVVTREIPDVAIEQDMPTDLPNGDLSEGEDDSGSEDEDEFSELEDEENETDLDELSDDADFSDEEDLQRAIGNLGAQTPGKGRITSKDAVGGLKRVRNSKIGHENRNGTDDAKPAFQSDDDSSVPNYTVTQDANGNSRYVYREIDPVYDSDDSDAPANANTIGNIPSHFYDAYPHIGYDINGKKIMRPAKGEALDALLDSIDIPEGWTGLTDPATGKPLELNQEELEVLKKLTRNEIVADGYDPYPNMIEYFSGKEEVMPLSAAPEPKRRFVPSKHEAKRVMKMVRAIREGRIKPYRPPEEEEEQDPDVKRYDIWADEAPRADHSMHVPAPKLPPPGYDESYRPPPEYLPDEAEKATWEKQEPEEREKEYLPKTHDALRKVAGYDQFVKEKFERCLDLYLAPRIRRSKLNIDPESLLPKLPSPEELRPFPTACATIFRGHKGRVRSVDVDPSGNWVATAGDDGTVRVWDVLTGRQSWTVKLSEEAVNVVRWRPGRDGFILAAAAGETIYWAIPSPLINPELEQASHDILDAGFGHAATKSSSSSSTIKKEPPAIWSRPPASLQAADIFLLTTLTSTSSPIKSLTFHRAGAHLATTCPSSSAPRTAVTIHTLPTHTSQPPFRRLRGLPQTSAFHPSQPLFFLVTQRSVRVYDLQAQALTQTLKPGARWLSSIAVHPSGAHVLLGAYDRRVLWHDLELGAHPFRTLRYHARAVRSVAIHARGGEMPLVASAADDGSVHVLHARVVADGLSEPVIVPVKRLAGHRVEGGLGVLEVAWHGREAWCVSVGADGVGRLWT